MNRPEGRRPRAQLAMLTLLFTFALALVGCGSASKEMSPSSAADYGPPAEYDVERSGGMPASAPMAPPAPSMMESVAVGSSDSYGGGEEMFRSEDTRTAQTGGAAPPPPPPQRPAPGGGDKKPADTSSAVAVSGPMLIYTAELTMASFEVSAQIDKIQAISRELGGFLARRDDTAITIRVPSERFEEALRRVQSLGDVLHRNVSVQDVTEEFRDSEVQLKNARAIRDRLQELLAKATKVEDSLLIERELGRVTRDIERLEGRLKFLRDRIAFSTLTVVFQPRAVERIETQEFRLPVDWLGNLGLSRLMNL
jgi:hypothetical protein